MSGGALGRLYRGETKIDFIGRRNVWFAVSGIVLLICLASLFTRRLNYGIEFQGGVQIQAPIAEDGPLAGASDAEVTSAITDAVASLGAGDVQIQLTDESPPSAIVQTKEVADPQDQARLVRAVADATGVALADTDSQSIGSKWGAEITRKAVRALLVFLVVVTLFIAWRFEWKMAVGAMLALAHDLLITAGVYSLVGFEVTPSSIIAILTILGYSLYDTVVVFDKVEENTIQYAATGRMTYQDSANLAMNQVFMRSLNTSLATLLPVAALLFVGAGLLGAGTLKDLALALFVGILSGTYSSIFVATPVLSMLKEREPRYRSVREKVLRDERRTQVAPIPLAAGAGMAGGETGERTHATSSPIVSRSTQASARPKAGDRKAKRRRKR